MSGKSMMSRRSRMTGRARMTGSSRMSGSSKMSGEEIGMSGRLRISVRSMIPRSQRCQEYSGYHTGFKKASRCHMSGISRKVAQ